MANFSNSLIPELFLLIILYGLWKKTDVFSAFLQGASQGLADAVEIFPALLALMTAIAVFKASGALEILSYAAGPLLTSVGLPREVFPLVLLRPLSGSGALVIFQDILNSCGADSYPGRVASVMQGSTETTFYTIALYLGSAKITKTRHCVPSALAADISGMIISGLAVRLLFYSLF